MRYPFADYFEGGREGYTGGVAVGNVVARPDPAPQVVREAHRSVQGAEVRHPGRELELVAHLHVVRRLLRARQVGYEPSGPFETHDVFYRMRSLCQETFYGMIQGPDTGREPELLGRVERRLRVQYHHRRDGFRVGKTALAARLFVGNPDRVCPFGPGKC